ncbi:MAG: HAD-IIIA family hydrolase [Candidatus Sumerlaeota bacterium]|nr:HAD-IIIA family hydrolase [Candidatus Sumerlaeota bacterium]
MIKAVCFDLGNTLLAYRDFGLDAYSGRLEKTIRTLLEQFFKERSDARQSDPGSIAQRVFACIIPIEMRARAELSEYDVAIEIRRALGEMFSQVDDSWDERVNAAAWGVMRQEFELRPDALETLRALKRGGKKIGLISNSQFRSADMMDDLSAKGLDGLLDATVFSLDERIRKPRREIFLRALAQLNCQPAHAVMVGDTVEADIAGARAAGMKAILIRTPENQAVFSSGFKVPSSEFRVSSSGSKAPACEAGDTRPGQEAPDAVVDNLSEIPTLINGW